MTAKQMQQHKTSSNPTAAHTTAPRLCVAHFQPLTGVSISVPTPLMQVAQGANLLLQRGRPSSVGLTCAAHSTRMRRKLNSSWMTLSGSCQLQLHQSYFKHPQSCCCLL